MITSVYYRRLSCLLIESTNSFSSHAVSSSPPNVDQSDSANRSHSANKSHYHLPDTFELCGTEFTRDNTTNITPKLAATAQLKLHLQPHHPLNLLKRRITNYFYQYSKPWSRYPLFAVQDNLSPVVTSFQNFDSLLVPKDHVSRRPCDTYYVNAGHVLRSHTSAHDHDLIRMGNDAFLTFGDCYRRDEIDRTHFPAFHQMEGVRLFGPDELFGQKRPKSTVVDLELFEKSTSVRLPNKQETLTMDATLLLERQLKLTLEGLMADLFGHEVQARWVDAYFPFTHPSWELEMKFGDNEEWVEMLGCGIFEQQLLRNAGASHKVAWAFGLGLERLAMKLYKIPDIRLFWSNDSGFLSQFKTDDVNAEIEYKSVSKYPQCSNDLSFWLPEIGSFESTDFYDLVRSVAGDMVEQVTCIDNFVHPKTKRNSHCYRIVYRHMERSLTKNEVNKIHREIAINVQELFNVEIRGIPVDL